MAIIFDFDSTLIKDESLVTLLKYSLEEAGEENVEQKLEHIRQITEKGIKNEISMVQSYNERLKIAKLTRGSIDHYLSNSKELLMDDMLEMIQKLNELYPNLEIRVLSQGLRCVLEPICVQFFGIPKHHIHCVDIDLETMTVSDKDEMLVKGKSAILAQVLTKRKERPSPIVIVGDGVSDMKVRLDGVADIAIGFGQWLQIDKTKELSDYYVTSVKELEPILIKCFHNLAYQYVMLK